MGSGKEILEYAKWKDAEAASTGAQRALQAHLDAVADALGADLMARFDGYHGECVKRLWRSIDEYRRACGTPDLPSDLILMAMRAVERAVEDICMRTADAVMNYPADGFSMDGRSR